MGANSCVPVENTTNTTFWYSNLNDHTLPPQLCLWVTSKRGLAANQRHPSASPTCPPPKPLSDDFPLTTLKRDNTLLALSSSKPLTLPGYIHQRSSTRTPPHTARNVLPPTRTTKQPMPQHCRAAAGSVRHACTAEPCNGCMQAMLRMDACWCACCPVLCPLDSLRTPTQTPMCVSTQGPTHHKTPHITREPPQQSRAPPHMSHARHASHRVNVHMTRRGTTDSLVSAALAAALAKHAGPPQLLKFNGAWGNSRRACQPTAYNCVCACVGTGCLRNTRPMIQRYTRTHTPSWKALHQCLL
jgi:hypothetical protein